MARPDHRRAAPHQHGFRGSRDCPAFGRRAAFRWAAFRRAGLSRAGLSRAGLIRAGLIPAGLIRAGFRRAGFRGRALRRVVLVLAALAAVLAVPSAAAAASHPAGPPVRAAHAAAPSSATGGASAAGGARAAGRASAPRAPKQAQAPTAPGPAGPPDTACNDLGPVKYLLNYCDIGSSVSATNDLCSPGPPTPEPADGGIDSMVRPPSSAAPANQRNLTLYQSYGMAGESWAPYDLKCSDMTSMMGNTVAGAVFDGAKSIDRIVITTYQSAAGEGLLGWLKSAVDRLITQIGNAVYFPYLAPVVLIGAVWLAWQGLIRRRATRTVEGTIWMVVACVAAIWLIGRPADFTGVGQKVSDGVTQVLNVAFSRLPVASGSSCVPVQQGDPQSSGDNYAYTGGNTVVNQNADELWSVLDCKPWLAGEFGTTSFSPGNGNDPVSKYGRQLLWAQAIAVNEQPSSALISQKSDVYAGIANSVQKNDPAIYPVFQGKQWPTRLEIGFSALFAALIAGVLVLLISITLIVLKIGFLLLLVAGPLFLIIGTHPGFGRVIAIRWFELLVGVLMKQVAVAVALSVLLYSYALVMATSDDVLPWALKILMIALLTVAVFIYRRPFQHLFASVGYQALGARERAEADRERAGFRPRPAGAATATVPGFGSYRVNRWARRNPEQADQAKFLAGRIAAAMSPGAAAAAGTLGQGAGGKDGEPAPGSGQDGAAGADGGRGRPGGVRGPGVRAGAERTGSGSGPGEGRAEPPPLNLPRRPGQGGPGWAGGSAGRAGGSGTGPGGASGGRQSGSRPGGGASGGRQRGTGPGGATGSAPPRWQPGPYLPARPGGARPGAGGGASGQQRGQQRRSGAATPKPGNWVRPIRRDK